MRNKFLLSVAASALLTTSAFSATAVGNGDLSITTGGGLATIEYNDKYGDTNTLDFTSLEYEASIKGSGAVSDALIRINVSDTNLSVASLDLDTIFGNQRIMNADTNATIAVYDRSIVDDANQTWVLFAGDSDTSVVNGKEYRVRAEDNNTTSGVTYGFTNGGDSLNLDVWSTSGSEEIRDFTSTTVDPTLVPQFTTSCIGTFDGLINIEALQDSFVNTAHDNDSNQSVDATDGLSQTDTLVFTVNNNDVGLHLEGNGTAITMQTRKANNGTINVDNNFSDNGIWNGVVTIVAPNTAPATTTMIHDIASATTAAALDLATNLNATGTLHYTLDGNLTFILPNVEIPSGTTTYYLSLTHIAGAAGIKPVQFVNGRLALEAGMGDAKNAIYPAGNAPRGASQDAGEWLNHAYISQIAGSEMGGAHSMETKYTIVNRSCNTVDPMFNVIYKENVYPVTMAAIAVDTQGEYSLADVVTAAGITLTDNDSSKMAVEITLPGIAEDFYVYAQVKNGKLKQFKDLPVYNTSERD